MDRRSGGPLITLGRAKGRGVIRCTLVAFSALLLIAWWGPPSPELRPIDLTQAVPFSPKGDVIVHDVQQEPFSVAEKRGALQAHKLISFELSAVPEAPRIEVALTVVQYACGLKPGLPQGKTRVLINDEAVAQWSFSIADNGRSYETDFPVDPKLLRVGKNDLEIVGERCTYGNFEIVRFHGIATASK